jgi:hypothetical protein
MKQKVTKPVGGTKGGDGKPRMIAVKDIHTHPMFVDLLPIAEDLLDKMILDMRAHGFYESEPIVLGKWPGQEDPVLIDGHMRIRAASKNGVTEVPFVPVDFESQMAALQHAMNLQAVRRRSTDGAYYRLCEQYDSLLARGGDRRSEEARSMLTDVSIDGGRSASARRTAQLIGCHYKKVDKIRKIRRDGTPQVQDEVRNDKLTINKAYDLIRKMELGEDEQSGRKLSAGQIKVLKSVLTEENLTALEDLDGDIPSLLKRAVEEFLARAGESD